MKALSIQQKVLGENHPETAVTYSSLAVLYEEQGRYQEAEDFCLKVISIREKILGENHPDTKVCYQFLMILYQQQGKKKEAEKLWPKIQKLCADETGSV